MAIQSKRRAWLASLALAAGTGAIAPVTVAEEGSSGVIEEIVVTSRRTEESLQDVPLAVSAFSEQDLERLAPKTIRDLDGLMPNVFIGMNASGPNAGAIFIRGQGYADIEKTQAPSVGVVIDGVFQSTNTNQLIDAFDIQQVEVNRGPQGVLFGKNTTGGTIQVTRTRPTGEWGFKTSVEAGNFNNQIVKFRGNAPIIRDKLALKIGGTRKQRDGYYNNIFQDNIDEGRVSYWSGTLALEFTPRDDMNFLFTYDRIHDDGDIKPQDPRYDGGNPFVTQTDRGSPECRSAIDPKFCEEERTVLNQMVMSLNFTWDLDWGRITSITALTDSNDRVDQDFDGAALSAGGFFDVDFDGTPDPVASSPLGRLHTFRDQGFREYTQELRVEWDVRENLSLLGGMFYFNRDLSFFQDSNQVVQIPLGLPPGLDCGLAIPGATNNATLGNVFCQLPETGSRQIAGVEEDSISWFASARWRPVDNIELALGGRWISEDKEFVNAYFDLGTGANGNAFNDSGRWKDWVIEGSATWEISDNHTAYFRYAEGFRSGGFSIRATGQTICDPSVCSPTDPGFQGTLPTGGLLFGVANDFEPEETTTYELGFKSAFMDRRIKLTGALFYTDVEDGQFSTIITTAGVLPGTNTLINNSPEIEIKGAELEVNALVHENFSIRAQAGLLDSERKGTTFDGLRLATGPGGTAGGVGPVAVPDTELARNPEYNWSVTGIYEREIGPGLLTASITYRGTDDFLLLPSVVGGDTVEEKGYELLNAGVQYLWQRNDGNTVRFFFDAKNITDEEYREQALTLGGFFSGFQGWAEPRMWTMGVEIDVE